MTSQFPNLFTPLTIGSITVKNRFMTTATSHDLWRFSPDGYNRWNMLGERAMHFHGERAKGGFALLTLGQAMVHPSCGTNRPAAYLEQAVDEYKPITNYIHQHGAKTFMQLNHNSRGRVSGTDDWQPVLATTPGPSFYSGGCGELTKEIEVEEIKEIVQGFAVSARNMQRAGFDGVEIQSGHSYLISELLTPHYNKRTDHYGGSLENRSRMLMEVIDAVRSAVGPEFPVGLRYNTVWRLPDGFTEEDSITLAQWIEQTGKIDFINATAWGMEVSMNVGGTPFGPVVPLASRLKKALKKTPVFVVGRILDPNLAESIIAQGHADMVAMARQSIADPEFPRKVQEGRLQDIRTCVGGSQGCNARHTMRRPITCTQNPAVGREAEWGIGTLKAATTRKKVLVVGGGPAGMEAAIVAAQRGHHVILCEREPKLGGQVRHIVQNTRRSEFISIITWRESQLHKLGVDIRLGVTVTPQTVEQIQPDAVIIATGSQPIREEPEGLPEHWSPSGAGKTGILGAELDHVYTPWDVLDGAVTGKSHVVVYDGLGYHHSTDPLEYLVAKGIKVTGLAAGGVFGVDMVYNDRIMFLELLKGKDVTFHQFASLRRITKNTVDVWDSQVSRAYTISQVDAVVLSLGNAPTNALYYALKGKVKELHRIGDCLEPRRIEHAHFEAQQMARQL